MLPLSITLKNYRPFEDTKPAKITIGPGFIAFVGPNNSGKSSLLRFFHEQKSIWQALGDDTNYVDMRRRTRSFGVAGAADPTEIFCNLNTRPISILIELDEPLHSEESIYLKEVIMQADEQRTFWHSTFIASNGEVIEKSKGSEVLELNGVTVKTEHFASSCRKIADSLYVGPFRNAISEGSGNYYDLLIGTTFIQQWDSWKNGENLLQRRVVQRVQEDLARIFGFNKLEINAAADKKKMHVIVNNQPYRLPELGAGLAQFLVVIGNVAMKSPTFLLIDEPELNLHPTLQLDFLNTMASYASEGIIFATHSLGLARSSAERIYSFQIKNFRSLVTRFEQLPNYAEFAGELSFTAFKELGHELILLVEGVSEVKAIQQFLRLLQIDHKVVIIPLGGESMIRGGVQHELKELGRLTKRVAVMIDSERNSNDAPLSRQRERFIEDCNRLNFLTFVTERRSFENYLTERAIQKHKGSSYRALGPYEALNDLTQAWAKHENWLIAQNMTKNELLQTDLGKFLASLFRKIKSKKISQKAPTKKKRAKKNVTVTKR